MDPHGDFANDLLPFIPKDRAEDVIYFNPADLERPLGLNMLSTQVKMISKQSSRMLLRS